MGSCLALNKLLVNTTLRSTRIGVDKAGLAADFLRRKGVGVMDMIAHFWDRLGQTPPLARGDLHLVIVWNPPGPYDETAPPVPDGPDILNASGAMLFVPKAKRADVFASDHITSDILTTYINQWRPDAPRSPQPPPGPPPIDLPDKLTPANVESAPLEFLTGEAETVQAMLPALLLAAHRKAPAKMATNAMMQLGSSTTPELSARVRRARDGDEQVLNRWRKLYKEERGILFDADVDAWIESGKVYVCENENQIVAVAKFDLELADMVEIGGVYTFPEYRRCGYGRELVSDLAYRIRQERKTPVLQVDVENSTALRIYQSAGWNVIGRLARVWINNS